MTSERDLLFALTRQRFTAEHRARAEQLCQWSAIDWDSVVGMAASEGVAPIVGVNLAACDPAATNVPVPVTERLQAALFENVAFKAERRREFEEQLRELDARGYDVLLLKSAALEAVGVYEHPWVTCSHDLDIILRARDAASDRTEDSSFRQSLNDSGVENDRDPSRHHDVSLNSVVRLSYDEMWRSARPVRLDGASIVYVMCPEDQLLTLCINSCRKRYFRLKALFDIAETAAHYPDLDWERFVRRVRESESEGVVFAALRAVDDTLGLPAAARRCCSTLLSRPRALVLGSAVTLLRRSEGQRVALTALQYACFNTKQRWRSAKLSAWNQLPKRTAAERAASRLPGE